MSSGLACWNCDLPFQAKIVMRDSILRGRKARDGGPYRLYRCPQCNKESKVETTRRQRLYASPETEYGLLDYLFGWSEWLSPVDFLRVARWQRRSTDQRRAFFEHDGDRRYSKRGLRQWLSRWWGRTREEPSQRRAGTDEGERFGSRHETDTAREKPSSPSAPLAVPHPFTILGVEPDASEAEIRNAFRRLARRYHPDKQNTTEQAALDRARKRFEELLAAYQELLSRK